MEMVLIGITAVNFLLGYFIYILIFHINQYVGWLKTLRTRAHHGGGISTASSEQDRSPHDGAAMMAKSSMMEATRG